MKLLPQSTISRWKWVEITGLALLVSSLAFVSALAAERPITFGQESPHRNLLRRAATSDAGALAELKVELNALKAEFDLRKANAAFYLRHKSALAPFLDALMGTTGE